MSPPGHPEGESGNAQHEGIPASGPLAGLCIVELAAIGPAPFAGALLADLGADVIRGDRIPAAGATAEPPARFDFYNRNKRSLALDLKRPEGVATVLRLLARADALTEGFRPGVAERLGLGPAVCLAANPRLVYGRMTGWGQDGPLALEAGHDIDYLAIGVLAAMLSAQRTGCGQIVDAAMVDGVANLMSAFQAYRQRGLWTEGRAENVVDGGAPFYGTYRTGDGRWLAVGAMEPQFYAALLKLLGLDAVALPAQDDRSAWPDLRVNGLKWKSAGRASK